MRIRSKAEAFNETYLESANSVEDNYDMPLSDISPDHEKLEKIEVKEQDVRDILRCIDVNKAYGPDNISPKLIKEGGYAIVKILTRILINRWNWQNSR